jgi:hypothetical protein
MPLSLPCNVQRDRRRIHPQIRCKPEFPHSIEKNVLKVLFLLGSN